MYEFSREYKILIPLSLLLVTYISLPPYTTHRYYVLPLICVYLWIKFLLTPYRIEIDKDNVINFRSIVKRTIISPNDIEKISDSILSFKVFSKNGNVSVSTLMDRPYELKRLIENLNRNVTTEDILLKDEDILLKDMDESKAKTPLEIAGVILLILALMILELPQRKWTPKAN